jgi:hypothetical protein
MASSAKPLVGVLLCGDVVEPQRRKLVGEAQQIEFLSGHSSIQTTERYLGSEQDLILVRSKTSLLLYTII